MNTKLIALKNFILVHKLLSGVILLVVCYGGYKEYVSLTSTAAETRYVIGQATKQTIISSVTGSGQVGTVNQIDLKPKVSGDIVYLGVTTSGQGVKAGALIAQIDATDAEKAVRDAAISLETARLSLEKLQQPPDQLELTQSENALARAINSKQNAEDDLTKAYDDGFNSISNAFLDLPVMITGLHDLLYLPNSQLGGSNVNNVDYYAGTASIFDARGATYGTEATTKYQIALAKYNKNFQDFKALTRTSDPANIEELITETYDTALAISDAVKSANNLIQFFEDQMTQNNKKIPALADTQLATLNSYTGKANTLLTDLLGMATTIKNDKNAIIDATRSIDEGTQSLAKLKAGTDTLDLRSSQLTVDQRNATLQDAKNALADYYLRAPFNGTIAKLNSKKGDSVSSATVIATLITKQKIAEISLNEVDAAKIAVGQKATLTFDAIEGLSIAGNVAEIDTMGTVSQGVVTYNVKISFDTQDERVKSGMTVNAAVITDVKQDVLSIPASAVKSRGNASYVLIIDSETKVSDAQGVPSKTSPREQVVEIGMSNDTTTEIVSGITEGALVVTRTIAPTAATAAAPSLFGGGGGATRALRN
ncbi:MAG: hypothetical protein A2845_01020 [Candidatus Lloydbacteria bacterium RIFCSPHIGHO2_01_FULL_49_22]|uniref:Membrane fusion protein biotin-lipoyl like domain-containing protein n=1 Tax=Candidatus Lloydbacteria bacterium RIFCSPHIGHO2_01_FULL_49_22 TaxID=1798658 RepID=A0A1G2D0E9_9BACT|nr:MAG: hypothetical protein A2845_01020 [Candidatus Lloydbacteria bacterium RIFCSPHIGHO2_01_FULL_49_22]OGZ09928.1 MAG: hypothetical protein A3C14_04390 [Candidatus Lloydbacteria bacterium RIFCSPHIGHO2_02_FULL_50_18]